MKLASYNIRKAVGRDRRRDPHRILEVINGLGADVVVLQEADRRLGARPSAIPAGLIAEETDFRPAPLAENDVSLGWHGNAILVRKDLAVTRVERISLPSLEPRGAVSVEIAGQVRVTGAHLGLTRRHRHAQLHELARVLDGHQVPSALLGDFNEWSRYGGMEALSRSFELHLPGPSFPTLRPMAALDRIAVSRDIGLRRHGVHDTQLARRASDHLPVWAEISLPAPSARVASG